MIESGLTWKTHIDKVANKVSSALGMILKIRPYVTIEILKTLYYSLIYSHISYAIEVWGNADSIHLNTTHTSEKIRSNDSHNGQKVGRLHPSCF